MYNEVEVCHTAMINESMGTALHVAVDLDEEGVVEELVKAIIRHRQGEQSVKIKALEMENDHGDTPLHVAASRGFAKICKLIIGTNNERMYLVSRKNKHGERHLFFKLLSTGRNRLLLISLTFPTTAPPCKILKGAMVTLFFTVLLGENISVCFTCIYLPFRSPKHSYFLLYLPLRKLLYVPRLL